MEIWRQSPAAPHTGADGPAECDDSDGGESGEMPVTDNLASNARRRFYVFSPDLHWNPSDFSWVNKDEALIDGRIGGRHEHKVEGYLGPICVGVPRLREKPKLVVGAEDDRLLDVYGFGPYYVSTKAKTLLCEIDAEGFDFVECDTVDGNGVPIEPYWMMDAIRMVHAFDESRSSFIRYVDRNPENSNPLNPSISVLNDIHMPPDFPELDPCFLSRAI